LVEQLAENLQKDYMHELCLPLGPGYATGADSTGAEMIKIVQTPSLIVILNPDLTYRQVFMDGRPLEKTPNPNRMGLFGRTLGRQHAGGGEFGFNDKTWLDHDGHPHTEALRMTERYTRRNPPRRAGFPTIQQSPPFLPMPLTCCARVWSHPHL
jgi:hypothetical protein